MPHSSAWQRLADYVRANRNQHHETQADAARRFGLSAKTIRNLESGRPHNYGEDTMFRVESSLGWQHGSFETLTEGGRPTLDGDPDLSRVIRVWPQLSGRGKALLAHVAEEAARLDI